MSTRLIPPQQMRNTTPHVCVTCQQRIRGAYFVFPDRAGAYCEACMTSRPRCTSCAVPVGDDGWQLHDGRRQCARCHTTAIYTVEEATTLFEATIKRVETYPGLRLNIGAAFRLIDAPTMAAISAQGQLHNNGNLQIIGLYQREGRLRVIYALYGLPRLVFREVVAHEYAHAWQGEHCPLLRDEVWREGFAEWVAYHHLRDLGADKAAERLRNPQGPYAAGLEKCIELEAQTGVAGVLQALRRMS